MTAFAGVVVAAGRGDRLGADVPKALVEVGGRSLVVHAVERLAAAGAAPLVVVHPPDTRDAFAAVLDPLGLPMVLLPGAETRAGSVRIGLSAVPPASSVVAVHDAARGLQPVAVIRDAVDAVVEDVLAAAPALPVTDTLKSVTGDEVTGTVDRTQVVAIQTPQVVVTRVLRAAHAAAEQDRAGGGADATDDLGLVERLVVAGDVAGRVVHVPGVALGTKITRPEDLLLAEALLDRH